MGTKRITNFKLEEQNYSFVQVQPELITMSNTIKVGDSSDSADDSNSSSAVTTELEANDRSSNGQYQGLMKLLSASLVRAPALPEPVKAGSEGHQFVVVE
ncbi:hypothetical protein SADUNF_Sadunf19G0020100 [Salix dunnii]|uniref:Uncharacterized protein n=1 Tax=Salix dunnii TaxID=1413687 RepID=A0A835J0I3_9ROSI|nr:hypothetical protein SADUNF_Sadunf19G0008800 [Salix dunnii]KAF9660979.1 hypothetical protein SADUNF_Sadunf19G0020100 [Salix dunnii]